MKGFVDEAMRALVPVRVGIPGSSAYTEIVVWVDTAFNGSLVVPRTVADKIGLVVESTAEAVLADGHTVELETFGCTINWLGETYDTQIVTNESEYGLIGTALLVDRKITIDYKAKTVSIE